MSQVNSDIIDIDDVEFRPPPSEPVYGASVNVLDGSVPLEKVIVECVYSLSL